jgi:hypothetical protein
LFFLIHKRTAVGARLSKPVGERHERALGVVRMQQVRHEQEEVQQSPFGERPADRCSAFAFTELFVPNVGMGHIVAGGCRSRIEGHNAIGV